MSIDRKEPRWQDLEQKGYLHIKGFVSAPELEVLRKDWSVRAALAKGSMNENYPLVDISQMVVWRFHSKMKAVSDAVCEATGIRADVDAGGHSYFATSKGINFIWHQDAESYYIWQQHAQYLNFYIPVVKPAIAQTNLCVIPFDDLAARIPRDVGAVRGTGAKVFYPQDLATLVCDEESGEEFVLPTNLEDLRVTPLLEPGDLLLLRGDVIHRTQDAETERVAVSFRWTNSASRISKARFLSGCPRKQEYMRRNPTLYEVLLECLAELEQDEITAGQFISWYTSRAAKV